MHYVYIIKSSIKEYYYIGSTQDLKRRFDEHNTGKTKSIKHLIPFELMYYEAYIKKSLAIVREVDLKKNSFRKKELLDRISKI